MNNVYKLPEWLPEEEEAPILETINWSEFWAKERVPEEWAYPNVIAKGRSHAIFAFQKTGKSLFSLLMVLEMLKTYRVVYLDWEQSEDDIYERLVAAGCSAETDLSAFHYALYPRMSSLDKGEGGMHLESYIKSLPQDRPIVVFIDTFSRAVAGDENAADTAQNYYLCTGLLLKRLGCTVVRLDHTGKDPAKGQRGTSAKGDDTDVNWLLVATKVNGHITGFTVKKESARMGWVADEVVFALGESPLRLLPSVSKVLDQELGDLFDEWGLALDATYEEANAIIRAKTGSGRRKEVVTRALNYYRTKSSYDVA